MLECRPLLPTIHNQPIGINIDIQRLQNFCNVWNLPIPSEIHFETQRNILDRNESLKQIIGHNHDQVFTLLVDYIVSSNNGFTLEAECSVILLSADSLLKDRMFVGNSLSDVRNDFLRSAIPLWYRAQYMESFWIEQGNYEQRLKSATCNLGKSRQFTIPGKHLDLIDGGKRAIATDLLSAYGLEILRTKIPIIDDFLSHPGPEPIKATDIKRETDKMFPGLFDHIATLKIKDYFEFFDYLPQLQTL